MRSRSITIRRGTGLLVVVALLLAGGCTKSARVLLFGEQSSEKATSADRARPARRQMRAARAPASPVKSGRRHDVSVAPLNAYPINASNTPLHASRKQYRPIPSGGLHRVTAKETVFAISRLYGVPVRGLIKVNGLKAPYGLRIGQQVRLPTQRKHVVAKGETVYGIARRYGVSIKELVSLNGISKPYVARLGETLLLPDSDTAGEATRFVRAPATGTSAASPPPQDLRATQTRQAERAAIKRVVAIPRPAGLSRKGFLWPLSGRLLSRFGAKGKGLYNDGINIAAKRGAPVHAAQNGVVVYRGNQLRGFGNLLLVKHANGYMTAYGHNSNLLVKRGEKVRRGQVIARAGSTGNVARPQLHFEIRKRRRALDPLKYLGRRQAADLTRHYARR